MHVLTFGEVLLRLAASGYTRLFQKDYLDATFCCGEANVAVSLAMFGLDVSFLTKLPANDIGRAATNSLRYFGVDTSKIVYGDGRMGLYYLEKGASQRPSKVIYDRKYSSIALAQQTDFDWEEIFKDIDWFHWSGINPALSSNMTVMCKNACKTAKRMGITVSCDLNYRKKLWDSETAQNTMTELMQYVDVCIANEEDTDKVLGIKPKDTDVENGIIFKENYIEVAKEICGKYGCKYVGITLRESCSASMNGWEAMIYSSENNEAYFSEKYYIQLVDRVGGGDSFAAGLIYGLIAGKEMHDVIDFAVASSCLKQTLEGDYNRVTVEEVEQLLKSKGSGRIQR